MPLNQNKKLKRISERGWFGGVCAGFAYYFEVPVWVIRLVWTFLVFAGMGAGILIYILFWIFMPNVNAPSDYDKLTQ